MHYAMKAYGRVDVMNDFNFIFYVRKLFVSCHLGQEVWDLVTFQEHEVWICKSCHMSQQYADQSVKRTVYPLALENLVTSQVRGIRVLCKCPGFELYSDQRPRRLLWVEQRVAGQESHNHDSPTVKRVCLVLRPTFCSLPTFVSITKLRGF
jgi:hypothetical protein